MTITVEGNPKEIAALVVAIQERREEVPLINNDMVKKLLKELTDESRNLRRSFDNWTILVQALLKEYSSISESESC